MCELEYIKVTFISMSYTNNQGKVVMNKPQI